MKKIYFECKITCAPQCCRGATLVSYKEIPKLRYFFPITVGFRKYLPANEGHFKLLSDIGSMFNNAFIVADFIAGDWQSPKCQALMDNNLCSLHTLQNKPTQCSIVPFCPIYPESLQDAVIDTQRNTKFSQCQGFQTQRLVWENGLFVDDVYREKFYEYQDALRVQKPFMLKLLGFLRGTKAYNDFLSAPNTSAGLLQINVPEAMMDDFAKLCNIPNSALRIRT